jgi:hypothetical protein
MQSQSALAAKRSALQQVAAAFDCIQAYADQSSAVDDWQAQDKRATTVDTC